MKTKSMVAVLTVVCALGAGMLPGTASESYLARFGGAWSGSGTVIRNADSNPWSIKCSLTGRTSAVKITVSGTCRAAVIISRQIGVDLTLDPATGLYNGVYTGSKIGPARLSGKQSGDAVLLTITWPKPVNGDRTARMTVINSGKGSLRITVSDNLKPGGPVQPTSDIRLKRI
jgi:hypothetical protein